MFNIPTLFILLFMTSLASASVKTLDEVIEERVLSVRDHIRDLETVAVRDRTRAWLPSAPTISYQSNDNYSWKAWSLSTSLPLPFKSLYRDRVETTKRDYLKVSAQVSKQDILRDIVEVYLECSVSREMVVLLEETLKDQSIVASISKSLYASGAVPQADRVASELQLRQLEAQVRMQQDLAEEGCTRWEKLAGNDPDSNQKAYFEVQADIANQTLEKIGLTTDFNRDLIHKKLLNLSMSKERLWSKFIPDLELNAAKNNYFNPTISGGPPVKYTYSWSVGITLPINFPFYDNTEYRRESAELGIEKIRTEFQISNNDKKWEEAKKGWLRTKLRLQEISSTDLALSDVFVESAMASYKSGKIGFADLVLARRTKLDLKIEEVNLKAQKLMAKTVCLTECEL